MRIVDLDLNWSRKMQFEHVFVIGAGGIGSHLMEPLARLLAYHKEGTKNITLIDGDFYEEKNRTRQLFETRHVGKNKAAALAEKIAETVFPISHHPEFINKEKFLQIVEAKVLDRNQPIMVITAVDNHATRKAVIQALDEAGYPNFAFLSGGNGYANGQIMSYVKLLGEPGTVHPLDKYDDLRFPPDHIPGQQDGCQEEAPAEPQLITANASAALGLLWTVNAMLENDQWYEELHFNSRTMQLVPQGLPIKFPQIAIDRCKKVSLSV